MATQKKPASRAKKQAEVSVEQVESTPPKRSRTRRTVPKVEIDNSAIAPLMSDLPDTGSPLQIKTGIYQHVHNPDIVDFYIAGRLHLGRASEQLIGGAIKGLSNLFR